MRPGCRETQTTAMNTQTARQRLESRAIKAQHAAAPGEHGGWRGRQWVVLAPLAFLQALFLSAANSPKPPLPATSDQKTLSQAEAAATQHDYSRAIALYQQVISARPENPIARLGLAKAYLLSRQFKLAVAAYKSALRRDPRNQDALIGLGEAYNLLKEYPSAEGPLRRALSAVPEDANAAWALSRTYYYEQRLGHAQQLLERVLRRHPEDFRLWESLGEVQWEQGRRAAARESFQRALHLNPKAKRSEILLQSLEGSRTNQPILNVVGFHASSYWMNDAVGNQILSFPQAVDFSHGSRWRSRFASEYRRLAFRSATGLGSSSEPGSGVETDAAATAGGTPALGIASVRSTVEFRVNDDLTLIGGGGLADFVGQGANRPLYTAGFRFSPTSRTRFSFRYGQSLVAPTELAARRALTQSGWTSDFHYDLPALTSLDLTYYQNRYSDSNVLRGGSAAVRHVLWRGPLQISAGYDAQDLSFARMDLFHGYFSPKRYIASSGLLNLQGRKGRLHIDDDFDIGQEAYTRLVLRPLFSRALVAERSANPLFIARIRNSYDLNSRWSAEASFLFYRSSLNSGTGAYRAYGFLFGLTRRFP